MQSHHKQLGDPPYRTLNSTTSRFLHLLKLWAGYIRMAVETGDLQCTDDHSALEDVQKVLADKINDISAENLNKIGSEHNGVQAKA